MDEADKKLLRTFSSKMRNRRLELRMSQMKLATLVDCHINSISRIESCQREPSFLMIVRIAKALQMSPKDFMPD